MTRPRDEDILGLNVPMNETDVVERLDSAKLRGGALTLGSGDISQDVPVRQHKP